MLLALDVALASTFLTLVDEDFNSSPTVTFTQLLPGDIDCPVVILDVTRYRFPPYTKYEPTWYVVTAIEDTCTVANIPSIKAVSVAILVSNPFIFSAEKASPAAVIVPSLRETVTKVWSEVFSSTNNRLFRMLLVPMYQI